MTAATASQVPRPVVKHPCAHWWWLDKTTGEIRPFECHSWSCPRCRGWRREHWIRRLQSADPQRHVMLSRLVDDPKGIWLFLAHLSQSIRRTGRVWEYFATTERHRNGTPHVHMLTHGDFVPQRKLSEISAAHGGGRVVWIGAIERDKEGQRHLELYVTKHLMRNLPHGHLHPTPRRVRYSRRFFPPKPELEAKAEVALEKTTGTTWSLIKPSRDQPGWAAIGGES